MDFNERLNCFVDSTVETRTGVGSSQNIVSQHSAQHQCMYSYILVTFM